LEDRLTETSRDVRQLVEKLFVKKNKVNLKMFRIKVDFYSGEETNLFLGSCISDVIKDTGNRVSGAMDLHDVSLQKSCTAGGRKVIMVSEFSLADDVIPVFRVYDRDGQPCPRDEERINQPGKFTWRKEAILFMTPPQNNDVINDLALQNKSIHLLLRRKSDNYESPKTFEFQYIPHPEDGRIEVCLICQFKLDTVGLADVELPKTKQSGPRRPRRKFVLKRKPECGDKRMRYSSSYSSTSDSSASSPLSQCESGFSEEEEIQQDLDLQDIPSDIIPLHLMPAISEIVDRSIDFDALKPESLRILPTDMEIKEDDIVLETPQLVEFNTDLNTDQNTDLNYEPFADLNTPKPFDESSDIFSQSFWSAPSQSSRKTSVILRLRDEIVTDDCRREKRPVQVVGPSRREVSLSLKEMMENDSPRDDVYEEESSILTSFPLLIVGLMLLIMFGSLLHQNLDISSFVLIMLVTIGGVSLVAHSQKIKNHDQ